MKCKFFICLLLSKPNIFPLFAQMWFSLGSVPYSCSLALYIEIKCGIYWLNEEFEGYCSIFFSKHVPYCIVFMLPHAGTIFTYVTQFYLIEGFFVILYSGRTKYSACASKLSKLSGEYFCPQKTQKAAIFFIRKGWRVN